MNKTRSASETTDENLTTSGHIVAGLRAKYYDIGNMPLGLPLVTRPHVNLIALQPRQSLLDIGSGTGEVLYRLHRKFGDIVSLYGIDPSGDMLDVARHKLRRAGNVQMELGAGEQLRFPDASFDWVVSSLTFHHVPLDIKRATIRESHRVLKSGGWLLISDFGKPINPAAELLSNIWKNHAFTAENFRNVIPGLILEEGFTDLSVVVTGGGIHHTLARKQMTVS